MPLGGKAQLTVWSVAWQRVHPQNYCCDTAYHLSGQALANVHIS